MPTQHLTAYLLEIALDRSKALAMELERIQQRQYPPTGPEVLIELAISANTQISTDLSDKLSDLSILPGVPDRRIEIFLRAKTSLLSFLHSLLQCVEGADIQSCPSTFVVPIRSMLDRQLKQHSITRFDFIVRASRAYNYMIWTIHEDMYRVLLEAGYSNLLSDIPAPFFIIECPISERRNIPIHCIFAHEVGHVWYQTSSLPRTILPTALMPHDDMRTKLIKTSWIEELASDAIALCLFGPAYLYAFIYFAGPFCSMNNASETHPPDNIRISFLCDMLLEKHRRGGLAYGNTLETTNLDYIKQWQSYARNSAISGSAGAAYRPITRRIRSTFAQIMKETKTLTERRRYTPRRHKLDIPQLCENIARGVPPNETILDFIEGVPKIVKAESILNAGWSYLISGDLRYAHLLDVQDTWKITNRLFDLVSKGLEYSEMQRRWSKQV